MLWGIIGIALIAASIAFGGLLAWAVCRVAAKADRELEKMMKNRTSGMEEER